MAGYVIRAGNRHFFHKTPISRQTLEQIAGHLGISQAVRNEILSSGEWIHIYVGAPSSPGAPPTSSGGGTQPTPPSGGTPPSPTRRRRRQSE
jgi:hypothetical protein